MPRQLRAAAIPSQPNGASTGPQTQGSAPALGSLTSPARVKRVKLIWLAALAAFALTAVAVTASSASAAEPEWGHCVSVKSKGHFEDGNCTKEDFKENKAHEKKYKGKFEWDSGAAAACFAQKHGKYKDAGCTELDEKKGAPKGKYEKTGGPKFTAEAGAGILKTAINNCHEFNKHPRGPGCNYEMTPISPAVECESEHATGEAAGSDQVTNVSVRFKGCVAFGSPATTEGLAAGEIQVNPLKGRLGYINKATHEVGVLLEPVTSGGVFAEFLSVEGEVLQRVGEGNATEGSFYEETGPGEPTGHDGIISPITPVNQMTHTFTQVYRLEELNPYIPPQCAKVSCKQEEDFGGEGTVDFLNIPSHFEGGPLEELEVDQTYPQQEELGYEWDSGGEEITNVNTVEGNVEIKG